MTAAGRYIRPDKENTELLTSLMMSKGTPKITMLKMAARAPSNVLALSKNSWVMQPQS